MLGNRNPRTTSAKSTAMPTTGVAERGFPEPLVEPVRGGFRAFTTRADGSRIEAMGWCPAAAVRELDRLARS
jgi:hypothetical protein